MPIMMDISNFQIILCRIVHFVALQDKTFIKFFFMETP